MKKVKIIYWTTTIIFVLFDGLMPALTSHTELAKEGIRNLGYPDYVRVMLGVFKTLGGIVLIIPAIPSRIKEWAYAGFGFSLIGACVSNWAVFGFGGEAIFPLMIFTLLAVSYVYYHKLKPVMNWK